MALALCVIILKTPPVNTQGKKVAMVISNSGLEELLSPLGFALGAALEGMEVHMYFQGRRRSEC